MMALSCSGVVGCGNEKGSQDVYCFRQPPEELQMDSRLRDAFCVLRVRALTAVFGPVQSFAPLNFLTGLHRGVGGE